MALNQACGSARNIKIPAQRSPEPQQRNAKNIFRTQHRCYLSKISRLNGVLEGKEGITEARHPSTDSWQPLESHPLGSRSAASKRDVLLASLVAFGGMEHLTAAAFSAEEQPSSSDGNKVFLDVKLEGQDIGRIVIEVFPDVPIGSARFRDLAREPQGVGYRLSRFDGIFPSYIRCAGVKSLSYEAFSQSPIAGGESTESLEPEMTAQVRSHDQAGLVSLLVRDPKERPVKERMIAKAGKLVTISEQQGEAPNGTAFMITRGAEPELDRTNLIMGRVVQGMEVVEAIAAQPYSKPRDSVYDAPFFFAAKAMGDKRADTAEKGFNRPLKRILVANSGVL